MDFQSFQRLEEIPVDANAFWDQAASESFFLSRWWFETVLTAGLDPGDRSFIGVLSGADGSPRGIVPGRIVRRRLGPLIAPEFQGLTGMYSCYFRPLLDTGGDAETTGEALGRSLAEAVGRKAVIHFDALDAEWPALRAFEAGLGEAGFRTERYDHFGNWSEDLGGRSFDDYLRARDGALREIIRRKGRALEREGRINYQVISSADQLEDGLSVYESVYARSWKVPEPYPDFQPLLMRNACREGALRLGICRIDGAPVAVQLWISWNGCGTVLKLAHDEQAKKLSVGSLLTAYMIRHLMEADAVASIDFGRGDDPYKCRWTTQRRQRIGIVAAHPRSASGLAVLARQLAGRWRRKYWLKEKPSEQIV